MTDRTSFTLFFFFNDTATTEIYTLSLHDALPISMESPTAARAAAAGSSISCTREASFGTCGPCPPTWYVKTGAPRDRKSTRLNSSHSQISYAVFCLKKKKKEKYIDHAYTT